MSGTSVSDARDARLAVVVLAAGQGTRMKSAHAKVLHGLGGKPLIRHVLDACAPLCGAHTVVEVGHTPIQREQLAKGAKPDVWIAANPADMTSAAEAGLVVADRVQQLARTHSDDLVVGRVREGRASVGWN